MADAVVIGAGFGGLALAIRLQSAGHLVTLVEARDRPGGRAYVYQQDGFTFDAGPTVITDPSCLEELFALSGRKLSDYVELLPITPFYRLLWDDGASFDYVNDQAELDRQIAAMNPDDVEGYRRFLDYSTSVFEEGYLKLGHVPFMTVGSMMRAAPQLVGLQAWRSVYSMVSTFVKDEHLRQALSFHTLLVGGNPFSASSIYALIHALERKWGVWFPRGGTGALVDGMARLFKDLGGVLRTSSPAEQILVEETVDVTAVPARGGQQVGRLPAQQLGEGRRVHLQRRGSGEPVGSVRGGEGAQLIAIRPGHWPPFWTYARTKSSAFSSSTSSISSSRSSEFVASRTADVANAIICSQPDVRAMWVNSSTESISDRAPRSVSLPFSSICSASRSTDLVELIGVGWPPRWASTTSRWTVLLPTSSTPKRTHTR